MKMDQDLRGSFDSKVIKHEYKRKDSFLILCHDFGCLVYNPVQYFAFSFERFKKQRVTKLFAIDWK